MMPKIKFISLLIITNLFSTTLLNTSFRQKIHAHFTASKIQKCWYNIYHYLPKIVLSGEFAVFAAYYLQYPGDFNNVLQGYLTLTLSHKQLKKINLQPCTDPELLNVFNTIKKDMGITTHIPLYIQHNTEYIQHNTEIAGGGFLFGNYLGTPMGIVLNVQILNQPPICIISTLAHELGHYLQYTKDPKSYQPTKILPKLRLSQDQKTLEAFKKEVGAEANAAGYQDCQDCLCCVQKLAHATNSPIHQLGYFDAIDYQPYVERAIENNWLCPAHEHMRNKPVLEKIKHMLGYPEPKHSLSAYLPQTYDRSEY